MTDNSSISDVKVVTVMERIDANNAGELENKFKDIISGGAKKLICDLEKNKYISSAGLRVFLILLKSMKRFGGEVVLCNLQPSVKEIFDMAGFSRLFKIFDSLDEAAKSLNPTTIAGTKIELDKSVSQHGQG
jgi:anti-anti-sigma factor